VFEQTQTALAEIERLLGLAGSSKAHMLSAMIWLADMGDFDEMNRAWMPLSPMCAAAGPRHRQARLAGFGLARGNRGDRRDCLTAARRPV
jgi:enamine deaminase RidA (YjgF/YER057c/UK114 family)